MGTRLLVSLFSVLLATGFYCSNAEPAQTERSVSVSGKSVCIDCAEKNVKTELAYQGLQVAIKCKSSNGDYKIKSSGELDRNGEYKLQLPTELIGQDGELKQECFAQLHSVSNTPCPSQNELDSHKLVLKQNKEGVYTFSTAEEKLSFSSATCTSAFFWPHFKKPIPKHPLPPFKFPPKPFLHPIYKKPLPPPVPTYKPPVPVYKPPAPTYKPPVHVYKPPVPVYKPIYKKPCPPFPKFPPIYHKSWPKFPPIYKKPFPKFPPIYKKPFPKYPPGVKKPTQT